MASVTITQARALAANKLIVSESYIPAPIQARADAIFDSCVAMVERKQGTDDIPEDVLNECLLAYFGYRYQVPDMRRRRRQSAWLMSGASEVMRPFRNRRVLRVEVPDV